MVLWVIDLLFMNTYLFTKHLFIKLKYGGFLMSATDFQSKQQNNHIKAFFKVVEPEFLYIYELVKPRTMLSPEALYDLYLTTQYCVKRGMSGAICEFGVWRGGSLELVAHCLRRLNAENHIVGVDTFEGHPTPNEDEIDIWGNNMQERFLLETQDGRKWAESSYQEVSRNIREIYANATFLKEEVNTSFDADRFDSIAILRLDMDWYLPTKVVLDKLFWKLEKGGCLIIDDYGHHSGARKALEEFLSENKLILNFRHINYSCIAANVF
jgi:O-methyltransferase